jgi:hypothetical protein
LAEENEEGGVGSELVVQGAGAEVEADDRGVECGWWDRMGHVAGPFGAKFRYSISFARSIAEHGEG